MDIRLHKQRLLWNFAAPLRIPSCGGTPDFSIVAESVLRPLRLPTSGAFFVPYFVNFSYLFFLFLGTKLAIICSIHKYY